MPEHNYIKEVDFVSGVVMIKRKLWEKTGGFDEQYTDYEYAAADLCFEVRNNGYKTLYQPFSVAVHSAQEGGTQRTKDIDRERFYSKWRRWLHNKSPIDENVFYERDRTVGERHVVFVDTESPQDSSEWSTTKEVVATLVGLNYSVKLLSGPEQTTMAYRKHFQQNEVEVLYGNDSYLSKQGWRYYFKTHLSALDAVVLDRSSFSNELVSYLRGNRYMGNIIFYDRDLNCLTLEKESAPRKEYTISEALNNADFNKGEKRYSFNKKKMADAFNTIIN